MTRVYFAFGYYNLMSGNDSHNVELERISLQPVLDNLPMGEGPKFTERVAWRYSNEDTWKVSCRCTGVKDLKGFDLSCGPDIGSYEDAVEWLKTGKLFGELKEQAEAKVTLKRNQALFKKAEKQLAKLESTREKMEDQIDNLEADLRDLQEEIDDAEMTLGL